MARNIFVGGTATDGKAIDTMPWLIYHIPDDATISSTAPGAQSIITIAGFPTTMYCASVDQVDECWQRMRRWRTEFSIAGNYRNSATGTADNPYSFSVVGDPDAMIPGGVDVVAPGEDPNERRLPHGRVAHIREDAPNAIPGELDVNATLQIGYGSGEDLIFAPVVQSPITMALYDDIDGDTVAPAVWYSEVEDAWFISYILDVTLTGHFTVTGDVPTSYTFGWRPGPMPEDLGTQSILNEFGVPVDVAVIGEEADATGIYPFESIAGYFYWPDGYATIDSFTLESQPTATGAFFEYRDLDGNNPVWHKDDGSQLIPVPVVMN